MTQEVPSAEAGDAAKLALECDVVTQAVRLARWIGDKPRPVTAGEVLRRADVAEAGAVLGVAVPGKIRTAADVPALHVPWLAAVAAGLLQISDGQARGGDVLARWPPADGDLLARWLAALRAVGAHDAGPRRQEEASLLAPAMLAVLARDDVPAGRKLWPAVDATLRDMCDLSGKSYSRVWDAAYHYSGGPGLDPVPRLFAVLAGLGTVTGSASRPRITSLGRWALAQLRASLPAPVRPDLPAADLLARMAAFDKDAERDSVAGQWLEVRTPAAAAREILAAADQASPSLRLLAIGIAQALGDDALPAWREMTRAPHVGPYARAFAAGYDSRPNMPEVDRRWLAVDRAAAALAEAGQDEALTRVFETLPGTDLDDRLAAVRATGHPEAEMLARSLAEFAASGARRSVDQAVQIKVTLTGWRPPIWRRVLVSAATTLGDLHRVIQVLYGWDGDHLHEFTVGNERYSDPFYPLEETTSEDEIRLPKAFRPEVRKITYTYDFGECWEHEITLEKWIQRKPGQSYPVCVAFRGDSPVEYWDEDEPAEEEPFSLTVVNRQLRDLGDPVIPVEQSVAHD